ncbi:hypothetical protein V494_08359 [Pseudogymnoascus sp. VKM F-4513 (FW-928)]|nr:hypothetical protein V494_08359 [Pseudogymnoascus sp. VKM F-4513 (FW-928)]
MDHKVVQGPLPLYITMYRQYLTREEEEKISQQFRGDIWHHNSQVLWSGVPRSDAQHWADERELQTLSTAMGSLMVPEHPSCLRSKKTPQQWSSYMKGASAVFAHHISEGKKVIVLTPPPPYKFHPSGLTNYQLIEEPILKGELGVHGLFRIDMVHLTVKGAENFKYQVWPVDQTHTWIAKFGLPMRTQHWRQVKGFTFPQSHSVDEDVINHAPPSLYSNVRGSAQVVAQTNHDNQRMDVAQVETRNQLKTEAKRATKGGITTHNKGTGPKRKIVTTQKPKLAKVKNVRQVEMMVAKPENTANVRTSTSKKGSGIRKPPTVQNPKAQKPPKVQKPSEAHKPSKPRKPPKPFKPQNMSKPQKPSKLPKPSKGHKPSKPQKPSKGQKQSKTRK